eukprot:scaffold2419_cov114-Isochrysis_galbana.AAC.12
MALGARYRSPPGPIVADSVAPSNRWAASKAHRAAMPLLPFARAQISPRRTCTATCLTPGGYQCSGGLGAAKYAARTVEMTAGARRRLVASCACKGPLGMLSAVAAGPRELPPTSRHIMLALLRCSISAHAVGQNGTSVRTLHAKTETRAAY